MGSAIARRLARDGLSVSVNGLEGETDVAPGFVPVERYADVGAEIRDACLASVPAGRMGRGEDVAHAVSFFASEEAGFVTGRRLVVDGGRSLRG